MSPPGAADMVSKVCFSNLKIFFNLNFIIYSSISSWQNYNPWALYDPRPRLVFTFLSDFKKSKENGILICDNFMKFQFSVRKLSLITAHLGPGVGVWFVTAFQLQRWA